MTWIYCAISFGAAPPSARFLCGAGARRLQFCIAALLMVGLIDGASAKEIYKFDQSGSTIGFSVHQFLGTTRGKFTSFSGRIEIDRERPQNSSVTAQIDVRSLDTRIKKRDDHFRSAEFFNVGEISADDVQEPEREADRLAKWRYPWRSHNAWRDETTHASCEAADADQ